MVAQICKNDQFFVLNEGVERMLGWFRQRIKEHGMFAATKLLGQVAMSRTMVNLANKLLSVRIACPCCNWQGWRLYDYIEVGYTVRNSVCPQCKSHSRHRYLYLWLSEGSSLASKCGITLLFAMEKALAPLWAKAPHLKVYRVDIDEARGVNMLADIQKLPVKSNAVDLIWCHHVLEHVENDRAAIKELHRVLRTGSGELILSVPMVFGTTTDEYGFPDPMLSGHWRMYGDDFEERLAGAGLMVQVIDFNISAEDCLRYAIMPERFYICKKFIE